MNIEYYEEDGLKFDAKERDPKYKEMIKRAEREAERECAAHVGKMGYCHELWEMKKDILKKKYGIDWKTPAEMNPSVMFD